jgi:hypothetical protein
MPFTLIPTGITVWDDESVIHGRLQSGAFFGPEAIVLRAADGSELSSHIHAHGLDSPQAWPVLPEHAETVIRINVPLLPDGFAPVLVTGKGTLQVAPERVDVSHYLGIPEFWGEQAGRHFHSDDVEDPALEYLGLPPERCEDWYGGNISALQREGRWPYIRVALPGSRYIELEMAAAVEGQERIWIGDLSGSHRVLLGYHSGHFSLPALRVAEVEWLASLAPSSPAALLWLSACYFEPGQAPAALARRLVSRIPGIGKGRTWILRKLKDKATIMADALLGNCSVNGLQWSRHPVHGWVNNWIYSQRNPESHMSILTAADFSYIRDFFP